MIRQGRRSYTTDWAMEAKEIRPGVMTARTLLDGDDVDVIIRVCNYSDEPQEFQEDFLFATAEPVEIQSADGEGTTPLDQSASSATQKISDVFTGDDSIATARPCVPSPMATTPPRMLCLHQLRKLRRARRTGRQVNTVTTQSVEMHFQPTVLLLY